MLELERYLASQIAATVLRQDLAGQAIALVPRALT